MWAVGGAAALPRRRASGGEPRRRRRHHGGHRRPARRRHDGARRGSPRRGSRRSPPASASPRSPPACSTRRPARLRTHHGPTIRSPMGTGCYPARSLLASTPAIADAERARNKVNLLIDHGVRTFVDLTTPDDRLGPYAELVDDAAKLRGLDLQRVAHPIPDMDVIDTSGYAAIVETIRASTGRGAVFVHCWGGIGRTATVVGCLLVSDGLPPRRGVRADHTMALGHPQVPPARPTDRRTARRGPTIRPPARPAVGGPKRLMGQRPAGLPTLRS